MKKRWFIIAVVLVGVAAGLFFYKSEPRHEGKSYSDWFRQFYMSLYTGRYDPSDREEALFALRNMGTNVYPLLVKEYFSQEKTTKIGKLNYRLMRWLKRNKKDFPPYIYPEQIHHEAGQAIQRLGPPAQTLLPLLSKALGADTNNYNRALFLLGCIGENREQAVPLLSKGLKHPNSRTRTMALQSLSWLGEAADAALPDLLQLFEKSDRPDPQVISLLGNIGAKAKAITPKLEKLCVVTNGWHSYAAVALYQIEPGNQIALNVLTNFAAARPGNLENRASALGEARRMPIEFIVPLTSNTNEVVRNLAIKALEKNSAQAAIDLLQGLLKSDELSTQFMAAGWLLRINRNNVPAQNFLINYLYDHKQFWGESTALRDITFENLGEASSEAKEVISALKFTAEKGSNEKLRNAAEKALKRIKIRELMRKEGWKDNSLYQ